MLWILYLIKQMNILKILFIMFQKSYLQTLIIKILIQIVYLYALLLDRLSVLRKNEWIDEDGNVLLLFSRREDEKKLKLSDKKLLKRLENLVMLN